MNRRDFLQWLSAAPVAYSFLGSGIWMPPVQRIDLNITQVTLMDPSILVRMPTFETWLLRQSREVQQHITGPHQTVENLLRRGFSAGRPITLLRSTEDERCGHIR